MGASAPWRVTSTCALNNGHCLLHQLITSPPHPPAKAPREKFHSGLSQQRTETNCISPEDLVGIFPTPKKELCDQSAFSFCLGFQEAPSQMLPSFPTALAVALPSCLLSHSLIPSLAQPRFSPPFRKDIHHHHSPLKWQEINPLNKPTFGRVVERAWMPRALC